MESLWPSDLFLDVQDSDVELRIEAEHSGKELVFPAHSFVLKRASPVFRAMLQEGKFKEGQTRIVQLKVPGTEMDAMTFHRYIYTKKLTSQKLASYLALLQVGHLYQVPSLATDCEKNITKKLTPAYVCEIAGVTRTLKASIFVHCMALMYRSAFLIFHNKWHLILEMDTMRLLLESEHLNVLDEDQVVEALWDWGNAKTCSKGRQESVSPVQEISALLHLVRWELVRNEDEEAPWFQLAGNQKAATEEGKVCNRKPLFFPPLLNFSWRLDIYRGASIFGEVNYPDEEFQLLCFSVDRDILLSGLCLQLTTTKWLYNEEERHFEVALNKEILTKDVKWEVEYLGQTNKEDRLFSVHLQLRTPAIISHSTVNKLTVKDNATSGGITKTVEYKFDGNSNLSHDEVNFSFDDVVHGVRNIFYFVR